MKQMKWIGTVLILFVFVQCQNQAKQTVLTTEQQIETLEQKLFGQNDEYNEQDAYRLMELYQRFADSLPDDKKTPDYLFKAADISMFQMDGEKTIGFYDQIMEHYPNYPNAPMCLFLKAFVYDNRIGDTAMAHRFYSEFVRNYPDHEFADDAEVAIKNLGKSPEELIREFESMNQ
ncbi:MAG: hypothetical protein H3C41_11400 [Bacteroidales bacterium]|nr:hypothetical protein [Bacteroidales bacterium]